MSLAVFSLPNHVSYRTIQVASRGQLCISSLVLAVLLCHCGHPCGHFAFLCDVVPFCVCFSLFCALIISVQFCDDWWSVW